MGALLLTTLCSVNAQTSTTPNSTTTNANPVTDGTTVNSGTGNASNGSSSATGASNSTGVVGSNNGTSYGMQPAVPASSTSTSDSSRRKGSKTKPNKNR